MAEPSTLVKKNGRMGRWWGVQVLRESGVSAKHIRFRNCIINAQADVKRAILYANLDDIVREKKYIYIWASFVAQLVNNPPAMQQTWVQSPGWEDSLEKGKIIHSSILAWTIQSKGSQRVGHD